MEYTAVIFDLFETLITEWGHKKYTKREMCSDLLGFAANECLFVGDGGSNELQGARMAGMKATIIQKPSDAIPSGTVTALRPGMDHGKMLYYGDGYVTAWFMWLPRMMRMRQRRSSAIMRRY